MKKAICLLTINPSIIWIDFLSNIQNYDIYIVVDNLDSDIDIYKNIYPTIHFVKISNTDCINSGFIHSSYMPTSSLKFNEIIAWDRALHYFTNVNSNYDQVWFFEDDCFFYHENTLLNIDIKYPNSDLLCKDKNPEPKDNEWKWFWPAITIHFPSPYFHSPICAVRMSKNMLNHLYEYICQHRRLCFIEALFPSIAHRNNLMYTLCEEMSQIYWRHDWVLNEFNEYGIFHPIKNVEEQFKIRRILDKKNTKKMSNRIQTLYDNN
jgi:hypothetical protein